jgi:hypothetical protein
MSTEPVRIDCIAPPAFQSWLAQSGGTLAISTYQGGKIAMLAWDGRQVTLLLRQFDKPMGMAAAGPGLMLATRHAVWLFSNAAALAEYADPRPDRYDALYLPRTTYHTGDLHTHDVAIVQAWAEGRLSEAAGTVPIFSERREAPPQKWDCLPCAPPADAPEIVMVATRFSCLATVSNAHSFVPLWKPPFISQLMPEDRCHLNGLAVVDGRPKYVTALGMTDTAGAWREKKATGGVLLEVPSGEVVLAGLAMPHSPRWYRDRLWLLNSGGGELLVADLEHGTSQVVCELPSYVRGLSFAGDYALVGMSKIREKHIFGGLPVQQRNEKLICGVAVVDIRSGQLAATFEFTAGCEEIYDVQFLPGVLRPMLFNLDQPAVHRAITNAENSFWITPSDELAKDTIVPTPRGSS